MRKLLLLPFVFFALQSFAGWEMNFCDSVDEKGNCNGKSESLTLSETKVLLANSNGLQTAKVYFEVLLVDQNTFAEELISTEEIKTEMSSLFANASIHFPKKGHYLIKARDSYKDYITSRELDVK